MNTLGYHQLMWPFLYGWVGSLIKLPCLSRMACLSLFLTLCQSRWLSIHFCIQSCWCSRGEFLPFKGGDESEIIWNSKELMSIKGDKTKVAEWCKRGDEAKLMMYQRPKSSIVLLWAWQYTFVKVWRMLSMCVIDAVSHRETSISNPLTTPSQIVLRASLDSHGTSILGLPGQIKWLCKKIVPLRRQGMSRVSRSKQGGSRPQLWFW